MRYDIQDMRVLVYVEGRARRRHNQMDTLLPC